MLEFLQCTHITVIMLLNDVFYLFIANMTSPWTANVCVCVATQHANVSVCVFSPGTAWRPQPSLPFFTPPSGLHEEEEEEEEGRDAEIVTSAPGGPHLHLSLSSPPAAVRNTSSHHIPTGTQQHMTHLLISHTNGR